MTERGPAVVVVGGGTAGCIVAARLAADHDVVVLEAGPDYGPSELDWPADLLDASTLPSSHDWGYACDRLEFDRAKVIGGCSAHNGCSQSVGWGGDYDAWAANGCPGWDAATLRPHIQAVGETMRFRYYSDDEVQPFQRTFVNAASALGLAVRHDLLDLDAGEGVGCAPVNITPAGTRVNTALAYLDQDRRRHRLQVRGNTTVDRVIFDRGHATGVEVLAPGGVRQRIDADLVVLSGGVYGTPEVLQRSGFGLASELAAHGIPVRQQLAGVGKNLHDHPAIQLEYSGTARLAADLAAFAQSRMLPAEQAIAKLRSPYAGDAPYDLHVYPWVEPDATLEHGWRVVVPVALLRPRSRGSVRLASADPTVLSHVDHAYLTDLDDVRALAFGLAWASKLDLAPYLGAPLITPAAEDNLEEWIRRNHQHYWHPAGSARMGSAGDPDAVVDHTGAVHGAPGLYVADASIFPDVPRSTTALPTAVVGERIAHHLRGML